MMMARIEQLDNGIKAIQKDVLRHMENKLNELKSSLISTIESLGQKSSYASTVERSVSTPVTTQPSLVANKSTQDSCFIDERYDDQSGTSFQRPSSQTRRKTVFTSDNDSSEHRRTTTTVIEPTQRVSTPQPVTVRVTNRNQSQPRQGGRDHTSNFNASGFPSNGQNRTRTLLIGDSILKGINYRGLKTDVKICAKSGASINDMWNEISVYDMRLFANIIICIGGNDCSRGMDKMFEDKYDQLISLIRSSNKDCTIYISKIVPRGDVDVSDFNHSVTRIVDHWAAHQVKRIDGSEQLFIGRNQMPSGRYFSDDGIHLSHSGTKRLLDAWNRHVGIIKDFSLCIFKSTRLHGKTSRPGQNGRANYRGQSSYGHWRYQGQQRNITRRRCYGCSMPGHILAECWNTQ